MKTSEAIANIGTVKKFNFVKVENSEVFATSTLGENRKWGETWFKERRDAGDIIINDDDTFSFKTVKRSNTW